jgi:hypothetical protein
MVDFGKPYGSFINRPEPILDPPVKPDHDEKSGCQKI